MSKRIRLVLMLLLVVNAAAWLALRINQPTGDYRLLFGMWHARDMALAVALLYGAVMLAFAAISRRAMFISWLASVLMVFAWVLLEVAGLTGIVNYQRALGLGKQKVLGEEAIPHLDVRGSAPQDIASYRGIPVDPTPFHYRTDQRGFRNAIDRESADIYTVGDSFLVGGLVPWEQTIPARIEASLKRPVINLALIQSGVQTQLEFFKKADVPLRGRLVLHFVYEGNDLQDSGSYRRRMAGLARPPRAKTRLLSYNLLEKLQVITQPRTVQADLEKGAINGQDYYLVIKPVAGLEAELPYFFESLAAFRKEVEGKGGRYAIVFLPDKTRILLPVMELPARTALNKDEPHLSPLREPLKKWCADNGVPILDVTDAMGTAARTGRVPFLPVDSHPNGEGCGVIAEEVVKWERLKDLLPKP